MQMIALVPYTISYLRFFLLLCRIPTRPFDWLMG